MSDLDDALLTTLVFREAPGLLYYLWTTLLFRVALHLYRELHSVFAIRPMVVVLVV